MCSTYYSSWHRNMAIYVRYKHGIHDGMLALAAPEGTGTRGAPSGSGMFYGSDDGSVEDIYQ